MKREDPERAAQDGAAEPAGADRRRLPWRRWKGVLLRIKGEVEQKDIAILAAGVAFFLLFALFPALGAGVSLYAYAADPAQVREHLETLGRLLPAGARTFLEEELGRITARPRQALGFGAALSLLVALWSARKGTESLIRGLNLVYGTENRRGFIRRALLSFAFTAGGILVLVLALVLVAAWPALAGALPLPALAREAVTFLRWPFLAAVVMTSLAFLYRYGPCLARHERRWARAGAAAATLAWVVASAGLSAYMAHFGNLEKTFGAVGGVAALMLWLYLSAFVILLGAELDRALDEERRAPGR